MFFSGKFKRQVSATANVDELPAILQYRGANDSVVAVFRNREQLTTGKVQLPLDTLRAAIALAAPSAVFYGKVPEASMGETWKVFSDNGRVRVHFPAQGARSIKIYSLTGKMVASREVNQGDAVFQLPKGAYLVRTNNLLNGKADKGKIINK
jgi:hypothetical protein